MTMAGSGSSGRGSGTSKGRSRSERSPGRSRRRSSSVPAGRSRPTCRSRGRPPRTAPDLRTSAGVGSMASPTPGAAGVVGRWHRLKPLREVLDPVRGGPVGRARAIAIAAADRVNAEEAPSGSCPARPTLERRPPAVASISAARLTTNRASVADWRARQRHENDRRRQNRPGRRPRQPKQPEPAIDIRTTRAIPMAVRRRAPAPLSHSCGQAARSMAAPAAPRRSISSRCS